MVMGVQTEKLSSTEFFRDDSLLVQSLDKVKAVENVLSIPGAINLVKDTSSGQLKVTRIIAPGTVNPNIDSVRDLFYSLPFYKGFLYNPATNAYMIALRID